MLHSTIYPVERTFYFRIEEVCSSMHASITGIVDLVGYSKRRYCNISLIHTQNQVACLFIPFCNRIICNKMTRPVEIILEFKKHIFL